MYGGNKSRGLMSQQRDELHMREHVTLAALVFPLARIALSLARYCH